MLICDLLRNQAPYPPRPIRPCSKVASMMVEHNIGAVPVLQEGRLTGIFSPSAT